MTKIQNDHELRDALNALDPTQQRMLGGRFAKNVARLSNDERVHRAIESALREDCSPAEADDAYRAAKSHATNTYTDCGKDTDWLAQADHFVAAATAAALTPDPLITDRRTGPGRRRCRHAWRSTAR